MATTTQPAEIAAAAKGRAASRNTSVTRAQIELAARICREVGNERAEATALKDFGDERHWHIAMFTDRKGATAFMLDLISMTITRPASLAHPAIYPTGGGGYCVVADDAPGPFPRIGDVERSGLGWLAWPMGTQTRTRFRTRREAVEFICRTAAS
jgi:hypothetical protein